MNDVPTPISRHCANNLIEYLLKTKKNFSFTVLIGSLVQVPPGRGRIRSRLASFKSERESVRQCFLFSNHMIIATR